MKSLKLTALGIFSLVTSSLVFAQPRYLNALRGEMGSRSRVSNSCNTCHSRTSIALNPFGKDYFKVFVSPASDDLTTDQKWQKLFDLDSDQDQMNNFDELAADRNPGIAGK